MRSRRSPKSIEKERPGLPQNAAAAAQWASLAQQNQQAGQQINQLIVQQQNAIAIARSTVSAPVPVSLGLPGVGFRLESLRRLELRGRRRRYLVVDHTARTSRPIALPSIRGGL